jgi:hypothetical protein
MHIKRRSIKPTFWDHDRAAVILAKVKHRLYFCSLKLGDIWSDAVIGYFISRHNLSPFYDFLMVRF